MGSVTEIKRSRVWYLFPIFFDILGGIIAYVALRNDDPKKAKNCLYLGIILTGVWVALMVVGIMMLGFDETGFITIVESV